MRLLEKAHKKTPETAADYPLNVRLEDLETARAPKVAELVRGLPERIPANDPRITKLVMELFNVRGEPALGPVPEIAVKKLVQERTKRRHMIDIYRGEWPYMKAIPDSDIPLPVDLFVAAPKVSDWREGRGAERKGNQASREVVRRYAAMDPKNQPPIQNVDVVVSAIGGVFLTLRGDGAHRLCAAKLRGDSDIMCRGVTIVELD